jgi:hypothetical protein
MARKFCYMTCSHDFSHFEPSPSEVMDDAARKKVAL